MAVTSRWRCDVVKMRTLQELLMSTEARAMSARRHVSRDFRSFACFRTRLCAFGSTRLCFCAQAESSRDTTNLPITDSQQQQQTGAPDSLYVTDVDDVAGSVLISSVLEPVRAAWLDCAWVGLAITSCAGQKRGHDGPSPRWPANAPVVARKTPPEVTSLNGNEKQRPRKSADLV